MQIKKNTLIFLIIFSLVAGMCGGIFIVKGGVIGDKLLTTDEYNNLFKYKERYSKLDNVLEFLKNNYYIDVTQDDLIEGAYSGLVGGLDDPYSKYVSSEEYKEYLQDILGTGTYGGVGITFLTEEWENGFYIYSVNTKGPAYAAGIRKGSYIVSVNGEKIKGWEGDTLAETIRGDAGTSVTIEIREADGLKQYELVRQEIPQESVTYEIVTAENGTKVAHVMISQFISDTAKDFKEVLDTVDPQVDYMVVDLRSNGGGLVNSALSIADMLMDQGVIVTISNVHGYSESYYAQDGRTSMKYVMLVDGNSASASEILTSAIKENGEAKVVGTNTYGKGIIQNTATFTDGSALTYTEYEYVSASGNKIHGVGIAPDYEIELTEDCYDENGILFNDVQLNKAIEVLLGE